MQHDENSLRHGCSPVTLLNILRTTFPRNTSGWLLLNCENKEQFCFSDLMILLPFKKQLTSGLWNIDIFMHNITSVSHKQASSCMTKWISEFWKYIGEDFKLVFKVPCIWGTWPIVKECLEQYPASTKSAPVSNSLKTLDILGFLFIHLSDCEELLVSSTSLPSSLRFRLSSSWAWSIELPKKYMCDLFQDMFVLI